MLTGKKLRKNPPLQSIPIFTLVFMALFCALPHLFDPSVFIYASPSQKWTCFV